MDAFVAGCGLNPAAPPFQSMAVLPSAYTVPPAAGLPASPVDFVPSPWLYTPPLCTGVVCCCCPSGAAGLGCSCAQPQPLAAAPQPASYLVPPRPPVCAGAVAWGHPALPPPPPPVTLYYGPPPLPVISDDGSGSGSSDDATAPEKGTKRSPRSVLVSAPPRRRAAVRPPRLRAALPPPPPASPSPPALRRKSSGGRKAAGLVFDPAADSTTLMIRNIPNNFMRRRFMAILDQHCAEENHLLTLAGGDGGDDGVRSEYDFLYLPIDFSTRCNKGYAFVNMTTTAAARRLHGHLQGHSWEVARSPKVCEVVHARIEGLDALVRHFSSSAFPCDTRVFLPVRFDPPRDGVRKTAAHFVGGLAPPPHH